MGKLNTLLDLASLGAELSMANQLEEMQRQGAAAAMIQAVVAEIRNRIFKYNEMAKDILAAEKTRPREAAGAMRLLELRLKNSGLSSEMFFELPDKEYMSNTVRLIQESGRRLTEALSESEQAEVEALINKAGRLSDYSYFASHHQALQKHKETLPASKDLGSGARTIGCLAVGVGGGLVFLTLCSVPVFLMMEERVGVIAILAITGLVMGAPVAGIGYYLFRRGSKGAAAKKVIDKLDSEVNIDRLYMLDKEFGGDLDLVSQMRDEAQAALVQFFGDSQLLLTP